MLNEKQLKFLERAIDLARVGITENKGGPFGCVIVHREKIIAEGYNEVTSKNDPTAHAEVVALMMAQAHVGSFTLQNDGGPRHELFSSCEPCAMCLGATLWSGVTRLVFAATRDDAMRLGFDEGPVFPDSYRYLEARGLRIERGRLQSEGAAVLDLYVERGGPIYNR